MNKIQRSGELKRELGVLGATMMGLGSIIGTGIFISIGVAAGIAGPSVIFAIILAALVALCNALSSAQLAANHPTSGGTYEYGYRWLNPYLGFTAGWMFLLAKSASAATAALGFSGYLLYSIGVEDEAWFIPLAIFAVLALTVVILFGIKKANWINAIIVSVSFFALISFVLGGIPSLLERGPDNLSPLFPVHGESFSGWLSNLLHATALMFVAYTGYGRIATLGEEVKDPYTIIPKAILTTLIFSAILYIAVTMVAIGSVGADTLAKATLGEAAPLEVIARTFQWSQIHIVVSIGAVTAMLGVLLNLILGLSRVLFAMGRRGDMPSTVSKVSETNFSPYVAVVVIGVLIAALASIGSIKTTWSFSAFTVLIYYAITNLAALRLRPAERMYSPLYAWCGLVGCLLLAFWIEPYIWSTGLGLIAIGLAWKSAWARERYNR